VPAAGIDGLGEVHVAASMGCDAKMPILTARKDVPVAIIEAY
jgi:hypothetical protein